MQIYFYGSHITNSGTQLSLVTFPTGIVIVISLKKIKMMIKKFLLVGMTLLFLPVAFSQVNFQDLSFEEAIEKAKKENKLVFVDVYAEWCGPCKMLDRDVFPDKDLGKKLNKSFISIKVDGDEEINWGLKESFGISA